MAIHAFLVTLGVISCMLIMGLIFWLVMPSLMLNKHRSKYNFTETQQFLSDGLQGKADWHLLKINDYQESTSSYVSLERVCSMNVCNPRYASSILTDEANRGVTAFMPLAVGIYENKNGEVFISQLNVQLLGMMFGGTIARIMKMAGTDLDQVVASVAAKKGY